MAGKNAEVIDHYPPQYIIGQPLGEALPVSEFENEDVVVNLVKIPIDYIYSNPTGRYNLSLPDR